MKGYTQEICRTRFFVGLRIEVETLGVLAALSLCVGGTAGLRDRRTDGGMDGRTVGGTNTAHYRDT